MTATLLFMALSLGLLYFGADWLVKGSTSLSLRLGVKPLVAGLTVVAFGTSTPELIVSINAALAGSSEIAVGNVVGSNIFNIGIILGLSALIWPLRVNSQLLRLDMPVVVAVSVLFTILFWNGNFGRIEGALFLFALVGYTFFMVRKSRKNPEPETLGSETAGLRMYRRWYSDALLIAAGLVTLVVGSELLVRNAIEIARTLRVSEAVIGLTIVAAGTSLPELATSVVAALKKNNDIAIGNIVGSNIYNLLAIMGCSALIRPIHLPSVNRVDLLVLVFLTLLLLPLMQSGYLIKRKEGVLLLFFYATYLTYLLVGVA